MKYAIVEDTTKVVLNMIVWDGQSLFSAPDGTTLVCVDETNCVIGSIQQSDGSFVLVENNP